MQVRRATIDDIDALVALGWRFVAYSPYGRTLQTTQQSLEAGIADTIANGVIFVADDGEILGAIAGTMASPWMAGHHRCAVERAWWVDETLRGSAVAVRLLRSFEGWAIAQNAASVVMSDLVLAGGQLPAGELFERLGYECVERSHVKAVT